MYWRNWGEYHSEAIARGLTRALMPIAFVAVFALALPSNSHVAFADEITAAGSIRMTESATLTYKNQGALSTQEQSEMKSAENLSHSGASATLHAQGSASANARYRIATPFYSFTVPKAWQGKVQWATTSKLVNQVKDSWSSPTGKKYKAYYTKFYLKGHKGDERYWLATISGMRNDCHDGITGFNSDKTSIMFAQNSRSKVGILAANVPVRIGWHYNVTNEWTNTLTPRSVSDQKKMLKLSAGFKVSYAKVRKWEAKYFTSADKKLYQKTYKYLHPKFKKALKVN